MQEDTGQLRSHLADLCRRFEQRGTWQFSHFLTQAEQSVLLSMGLSAPVSLFGGFEGAERAVACFGSEDACGYEESPPVTCLRIEPVNAKFADKLTHRDFLGSLMALGIKREMLGDIVVQDDRAYLFCMDSIAAFIALELTQVKHTTVRCVSSQPPQTLTQPPEPRQKVVASDRLDALVAGVYDLSRSEAKSLVESERVFIDSRLAVSAGAQVKPGSIVSVRGHGRFKLLGTAGETRRGRMRVDVIVY